MLDTLNSTRFCDKAPETVFAELLDEGVYLCCPRTMYRLLLSNEQVRERRDQLRHPTYQRPELLATAPRQVWSWDISLLRGPSRGSHFHLYVLLDIFSRFVVGWTLALRESGQVARRLVETACEREGITPDHLTVHADNGAAPTSREVRDLLAALAVAESHSRPYTSNDNCFSESHFRTLKYRPTYPDRFSSFSEAQSWCREFFDWYNSQHRHSGIAYLTPESVHLGRASEIIEARREILLAAYRRHPERFPNKVPAPPALPLAVYINPPHKPAGTIA